MEDRLTASQNVERSVIEEYFTNIFSFLGDDPKREGLEGTPERVVRSWQELFSGYRDNPKKYLKVFTDGTCDEMVILRNFEFNSFCEHHFLPFTGIASIGYIPHKKVIGISKLARIFDCFAKRLQIQERLTTEVAEFVNKSLNPQGVMVIVKAKHFCISERGVMKKEGDMVTSAIRGEFKRNAEARNEFMQLING